MSVDVFGTGSVDATISVTRRNGPTQAHESVKRWRPETVTIETNLNRRARKRGSRSKVGGEAKRPCRETK